MSKSKKKLIILSANTSWYLYNFRKSTILAFLNEGYSVVCLSPRDEYSIKLQLLGCEWQQLNIDNKGINPLSDLYLLARMFVKYRKIKPIMTFHFTVKNNIFGTFAAFLARIPAINNITGLGTAFINNNIISLIVRMLYRLSQPLAHKVFCQNQDDFDLLKTYGLVPARSLALLPGSGVDLDRFHPDLRNPFQDHKRIFRFIYSGRMLADKGLYELMHAMSNINKLEIQCHLWVCGFADAKNKSAISKKTLDGWSKLPWVEWIGATDEVEKVMAKVDCLILPSYREGMPKCILEANAMALPVVATDVPGCRNIVEHKITGLLCAAKDQKALGSTILEMVHMSASDRALMGGRARDIVVKNFDERIVVQAAMDAANEISHQI